VTERPIALPPARGTLRCYFTASSRSKRTAISTGPLEFNLPDDAAALKEAKQRLGGKDDGKDIEIWEGARLVA
jgi:hypothetical protein